MNKISFHPASFRDTSGKVFFKGNKLYRSVNSSYQDNYNHLIESGLYKELEKNGMIVNHIELDKKQFGFGPEVYKVIKPEFIGFISYPYEWSIGMYREAALLTLRIQKIANSFGMSLKDASSFNIQFKNLKPILIDTLSFEKSAKNTPWIAYRQFCRHFLAPLALQKFTDLQLVKMQSLYIDGIPLDLAVKLLPLKSFFNIFLFIHLYLHNLASKKLENNKIGKKSENKTVNSENLLVSLETAVKSCGLNVNKSVWSDYYNDNNYSRVAKLSKFKIVEKMLKKSKSEVIADFGSNTGVYSRLAAKMGKTIISIDNDPLTVNMNYQTARNDKLSNILPLNIDLFNPTPHLGWENGERESFLSRLRCDTILGLALIHHLYFTNNLSFEKIAGFLNKHAKTLIIEFIDPQDSQVISLKGLRNEDFSEYDEKNFLEEFSKYFRLVLAEKIDDSYRKLFLFSRKI